MAANPSARAGRGRSPLGLPPELERRLNGASFRRRPERRDIVSANLPRGVSDPSWLADAEHREHRVLAIDGDGPAFERADGDEDLGGAGIGVAAVAGPPVEAKPGQRVLLRIEGDHPGAVP